MPIYNIHVVLMVYVYYNRIYYYLLNYYCNNTLILNVFKLLLVYVCKVMQCYTIITEQQHINNNL